MDDQIIIMTPSSAARVRRVAIRIYLKHEEPGETRLNRAGINIGK